MEPSTVRPIRDSPGALGEGAHIEAPGAVRGPDAPAGVLDGVEEVGLHLLLHVVDGDLAPHGMVHGRE